jgi:hypothetical protein
LFEIRREKLPPRHNLYSAFKRAPQLERTDYETRSFIMICEKSFEAIEITWVKIRSGFDFDSSKWLLTSTYNQVDFLSGVSLLLINQVMYLFFMKSVRIKFD